MKKRIITISREFGSGGRFIGEEVAKKLGIAYYDKNIINEIAEKSGLSPEYIQENAELSPKKGLFAYAFAGRDVTGKSVEDLVYEAQRKVILELAEKEPCVIIGRNADYILKDRDDVLNVFIHGDDFLMYSTKVTNYPYICGCMEQNIPAIYAAPLQGFTEAAWRNAHEQTFGGVDAYYTPFIRLEKGEIRNKDKREVLPRQNTVSHLIPQLVASEPEELNQLAGFLASQGYREIDVNMGCPFPLIANRGKGSGILPYPEKVAALLDAMRQLPEIRFSVKMRLGWLHADEWKQVLPLLNGSGVSQITLHPRIGKQQYKGEVNRVAFKEFYDSCELPLVYNGDLCTLETVQELLEEYPRLKGVMLGRGLLADPSLALSVRKGQSPDKTTLYRQVSAMHGLMYEHYCLIIEGGEAQLLAKLKTMWEYLLPDIDKKSRKLILKSNRLDTYLRAVEEALR